jgi:hypothetical protein
LLQRFTASLVTVLVAGMLLANTAWGSYLQDQPSKTAVCCSYAASNLINWVTGAHTTGWQIHLKFKHYQASNGAAYLDGRNLDLMLAVAKRYHLHVTRFGGSRLPRGFRTAKRAIQGGGGIIMLAKSGALTGTGHCVMGYGYKRHGDKIAVSDSNRFNPDTWYSVSWLLNPARGHVVLIYAYT